MGKNVSRLGGRYDSELTRTLGYGLLGIGGTGAIIAALSFVGGFFGAKTDGLFDPALMRNIFVVCLARLSVKMFFS
jgi:uncharacterized membrane protein YfcA